MVMECVRRYVGSSALPRGDFGDHLSNSEFSCTYGDMEIATFYLNIIFISSYALGGGIYNRNHAGIKNIMFLNIAVSHSKVTCTCLSQCRTTPGGTRPSQNDQ